MKFAVTVVAPEGYIHSAAFLEVAETIHCGLKALGHDSLLTTLGLIPERRHIIIGSNLLPTFALPIGPDAILYNLEQIYIDSPWLDGRLIEIFKRYAVWDYSQQNAKVLAELGIDVEHILPIGYTPQLTRIQKAAQPDIDVLFIGSINERRKAAVEAMRASGLNVVAAFGVYGAQRDALIARAKLMLNAHFYDAKVLEIVRISYYLANKCAVLSERSSDPAEDANFEQGVAFADYEDLPQRALALCRSPDELQRLSSCGFEIMRKRAIEEYLRPAIGDGAITRRLAS